MLTWLVSQNVVYNRVEYKTIILDTKTELYLAVHIDNIDLCFLHNASRHIHS